MFLHEDWPRGLALWGAVLVVGGIAGFAALVARPPVASQARVLRTERGA